MAKADQNDAEFDPNAAPAGEATEGLQFEDGDGFSFNMKEEKASSGYPLIPVGTHDGTIDDCIYKISGANNPMWQVKWAVPVQEQDKDDNPVTKVRKVTAFVVFNAENRGRAKAFVQRVHPELAQLEDFNPKLLASQMVGRAGRVKITHQEGQDGEIRSNVADVLAPAGGSGGGFGGL